jgi:hypothetical protein
MQARPPELQIQELRAEVERLTRERDQAEELAALAVTRATTKDGKLIRLQCRVERLFDFIKHGDDKHQAWLKEAILKHFDDVAWPSFRAAYDDTTGTREGGWGFVWGGCLALRDHRNQRLPALIQQVHRLVIPLRLRLFR